MKLYFVGHGESEANLFHELSKRGHKYGLTTSSIFDVFMGKGWIENERELMGKPKTHAAGPGAVAVDLGHTA